MARIFKRGRFWWIEYERSNGRRRESLKVTSKKLAQEFLDQYTRRQLLGETEVLEELRFSEFAELYMELKVGQKSEHSRNRDADTLKKLIPHFGHINLNAITRENIERFKANRINTLYGKYTKKTIKATTVNKELCLLRAIFTEAKHMGYLRRMPKLDLLPIHEFEPKHLSPEQATKLLDTATGQIKVFIAIGLNTGLRSGEIYQLEWEDVHLDRRYLVVQQAKGRRFRSLPINDHLLEVLTTHPRHKTSEYVLYKSDGSRWKDLRESFNNACKEAGVPKIRIHDMRHTFISNLVMSGVDLRQVQDLAGHRDIKTTMQYAHLSPERGLRAVNSLDWSKQKNADESGQQDKTMYQKGDQGYYPYTCGRLMDCLETLLERTGEYTPTESYKIASLERARQNAKELLNELEI